MRHAKGHTEVEGTGVAVRPRSPSAAPMLAPALEKKLLVRLADAEDADSAAKLLAKAVAGTDIVPLLTDLLRRQKLGLQDGVLELMQRLAGELDPAAIHGFFDSFGDECAGEPPSDFPVLRGFGQNELSVLARSYAEHSDYWEGASLSRLLEGALALVRAGADLFVDAAIRDRLLDELAAGVLTFADLPGHAYQLGITPEEWGRKTLPFVARADARYMVRQASVEALVLANWDDAKRILSRTPFHGPSFVEILLRREAEPRELLALGERLRAEFESHLDCGYLVMALLPCVVRAGISLPDVWDPTIAGTVVWFDADRDAFAEAFAGADRSIAAERCHRIIRQEIASDDNEGRGHFAYPLLRHAWDEQLFASALAGLKNKSHLAASVYHDESESLGLIGTRALPTLVQELGVASRTPETGLASALWHSVLIASAVAAQAGELEQRYLDVLVEPGFQIGQQSQFYCWRYWQRLLRALPGERVEAFVASWKAASKQDRWEGCIPNELKSTIA